MRVHIKNLDVWRAMPIEDFVVQMRAIMYVDSRILCDKNFGILLRERKDEIIEYLMPER